MLVLDDIEQRESKFIYSNSSLTYLASFLKTRTSITRASLFKALRDLRE